MDPDGLLEKMRATAPAERPHPDSVPEDGPPLNRRARRARAKAERKQKGSFQELALRIFVDERRVFSDRLTPEQARTTLVAVRYMEKYLLSEYELEPPGDAPKE